MPYNLKPTEPPFEVVDGPFAGRKYDRKGIYAEIPPQYAERFEPFLQSSEAAKQPVSHLPSPIEGSPEVTHE
jgi:hypothetical protein